jgi:hypothetical protein
MVRRGGASGALIASDARASIACHRVFASYGLHAKLYEPPSILARIREASREYVA